MRTWKLAATAVLAVLALGPLASSASAARGMEVGVQDDGTFTGSYFNEGKAIADAQKLHTSYIRVFLPWADIAGSHANSRKAPRSPHYNFHGYDGVVYLANLHHMQVQFVLTGPAPAWATSNHRKGSTSPRANYFAQYALQAANWFKGRVHRWSIWNEPNFKSWLQPMNRAPAIYRSLYINGYNQLKRVDPTNQVLIGEFSPYAERGRATAPLAFLRSVLGVNRSWKLKRGVKGLVADGFAQHPYDFYHSPTYRYPGADNVTMGTLGRLSGALSAAARTGALRTPAGTMPRIFLTEYGYLSSGHGKISPKKHAKYLVKGFQIALSNPYVDEVVQYTLVPPHGRYKFFDMSILTSKGKATPAFTALEKWAASAASKHLLA